MIYLAIHTHDSDKCVSKDPELVKKFKDALSYEAAKKNSCRLINVYVASTEHIAYIIFEADQYKNMMGFLRPLLQLGSTRITPVDEWGNVSTILLNE